MGIFLVVIIVIQMIIGKTFLISVTFMNWSALLTTITMSLDKMRLATWTAVLELFAVTIIKFLSERSVIQQVLFAVLVAVFFSFLCFIHINTKFLKGLNSIGQRSIGYKI